MESGVCPFTLSLELMLQVFLTSVLLIIHVGQGVLLDTYLIMTEHTKVQPYFWLVPDFFFMLGFVFLMSVGYRHRKIQRRSSLAKSGPKVPGMSKLRIVAGYHPYVWLLWLFYSVVLVSKIVLIFKSEVINTNSGQTIFGPTLLKILLASTSILFVLLVEGFHNAKLNTSQHYFINSICIGTAVELLDSISFLSLLIQSESHIVFPFYLENCILAFSCINLMLPTLTMYMFSLSDFGVYSICAVVAFAHKMVHLWLVNLPYIIIRLVCWNSYRSDVSVFIVKNVLNIFLVLLNAWPDAKESWHEIMSWAANKRRVYNADEGKRNVSTSSRSFGDSRSEESEEIEMAEWKREK